MASQWTNGIRSGGCLEQKCGRCIWDNNPKSLATKNKNKALGWIKPPGTLRKKKVLATTPKRVVYKNKETFGLLPARNAKQIEEFDPLWCADFTNLNCKFIMKMLWTLDTNENIGGLSEEGYNWCMENYQRVWLKYSGPKMFERMIPIEPHLMMVDEHNDYSEEGKARMKKALVTILIRCGGPIKMSNEERTWRADAVGDVMKTCLGYIAYPCEPSIPVVQCGVCKVYNLYSHLDHGAKITDTQWRCACCWADLAYEIVQESECVVWDLPFDAVLGIHGGSQLDELMLMNYGDVYDDLDLNAKRQFVAKDTALIRKYFNNVYQSVVEIGANLSEIEKNDLRNQFPRLFYVYKPRSSHGSKTLWYELLSTITNYRPKGKDKPLNVYGFDEEMHPANVMNNCTIEEANMLVMFNKPITMGEMTSIAKDTWYVILPLIDDELTGFTGLLSSPTRIYYQLGATSTVGVLDRNAYYSILENDVIVLDNCHIVMQEEAKTCNWLVKSCQKLKVTSVADWKTIKRQPPTVMKMPLPDFYGAISNPAIQTWKEKSFRFDRQFLNMLIIRNIAGNLSFNSLREFAVGYAMRSYSAQGRVSKNLHILYELIDAHTLMAMIMSTSMTADVNLNQFVVNMQDLPIIKSVGVELANEMVAVIQEVIKMELSKLLTISTDAVMTAMSTYLPTVISGWKPNSSLLQDMVYKPVTTLDQLRIMRFRTTTKLPKACLHHVDCDCVIGNPRCVCCGWARAMAGKQQCVCCTNTSRIDFYDPSKYIEINMEEEDKKHHYYEKKTKLVSKDRAKSSKTRVVSEPLVVAANKAKRKLEEDAIEEKNKYVTANNFELSMLMQNPEDYFRKNEVKSKDRWVSVVRFNFKEENTPNTSWFEIEDYDVNVDVEDSNCAREAFMKCTGIELAADALPGDDNNMVASRDILALAAQLAVNVLICHESGAMMHQANASNEFATIIHGSCIEGVENNHFMPGRVKQVNLLHNYPNRVWHADINTIDEAILTINEHMNADNVDHDTALIVDEMMKSELLDSSITFKQLLPVVELIGGTNYFTNNPLTGDNNIYAGKIHTPIRDELAKAMSLIAEDSRESHKDIEISSRFDRLDLDIDNLEEELNKELKAEICNWLTIVNTFNDHGKINQHDVKSRIKAAIEVKHGLYVTELIDKYKFKTLDLIFVQLENRIVRAIVMVDRVNSRLIIRPEGVIHAGKCTIYQLKASFSSFLRKLCNSGSKTIHFRHATQLMKDMSLISGRGGSGKTEILAKRFSSGDIAIAMTTTPIQTIKDRLRKFGKDHLTNQVMTLERASTSKPKISGTIYADEAKQLSLNSLLPIITLETKEIVLVGDTSQAGAVDMLSNVYGERYAFNLTNAVIESNVINLKISRRVGYPLADQIAMLDEGFTGNPEKTTTWSITHLGGLDQIVERKLVDIIEASQPDVILAAQLETVQFIESVVSEKRAYQVSTIFSYQSKEANRVMMVMKPNSNGKWGISRDRYLLISALTRAMVNIDIVVINSANNETEAGQLVDIIGAGTKHTRESFELPLAEQQEKARIESAKFPGTTMTISKTNEGLVYDISAAWGAMKAKMVYNKGTVKVTGSHMIKKTILDAIDYESLKVMTDHVEVQAMNLGKMRALAWIIDKFVGPKLGMRFYWKGSYYRIIKNKSCPYNATITMYKVGLTCETLQWQLAASGTWSYLGQRHLLLNNPDEVCHSVLAWMEVIVANRRYVGDCFLDDMTIPKNINSKLMWERISRLPMCLLNCASACSYAANCKDVKHKSQQHLETVVKHSGVKLNKKIEHVINHKMLVVARTAWASTVLKFGIYYNGEFVKEVRTWWSADKQVFLWEKMLSDVNNLENAKVCGELEGLSMSLAKHKEHKTPAYAAYRSKMSALKSYTINALDNSIWVSKGREDDTRVLVKSIGSNIFVNTHNFNVNDIFAELFDGLLLLSKGSVGKNSVVTYAGVEPILPSLYSMHYMKLWHTDDHDLRLYAHTGKMEEAIHQLEAYLLGIAEDKSLNIKPELSAAVVTDPAMCGQRVIVGTALMYTPIETIENWLQVRGMEVYGCIPTPAIDIRLGEYRTAGNSTYFVSNFTGIQIPIHVPTLANAMGWPNSSQMRTGKFMKFEVYDVMMGVAMVKITAVSQQMHYLARIMPKTAGDNWTIKLPWFQPTIKEMIVKKRIFTTKELIVKPHLFRSLCMRMLLDNNVQLKDLLAYARTLGSAYETSEVSFRMKYTVKVDVLIHTAFAAWYYHKQMGKKFAVATKLWTDLKERVSDAVILNVVSILTELLSAFTLLSDYVEDYASQLNEILLDKTVGLGLPLQWIGKCDERLIMMFDFPGAELIPMNRAARLYKSDFEEELDPLTPSTEIKRTKPLKPPTKPPQPPAGPDAGQDGIDETEDEKGEKKPPKKPYKEPKSDSWEIWINLMTLIANKINSVAAMEMLVQDRSGVELVEILAENLATVDVKNPNRHDCSRLIEKLSDCSKSLPEGKLKLKCLKLKKYLINFSGLMETEDSDNDSTIPPLNDEGDDEDESQSDDEHTDGGLSNMELTDLTKWSEVDYAEAKSVLRSYNVDNFNDVDNEMLEQSLLHRISYDAIELRVAIRQLITRKKMTALGKESPDKNPHNMTATNEDLMSSFMQIKLPKMLTLFPSDMANLRIVLAGVEKSAIGHVVENELRHMLKVAGDNNFVKIKAVIKRLLRDRGLQTPNYFGIEEYVTPSLLDLSETDMQAIEEALEVYGVSSFSSLPPRMFVEITDNLIWSDNERLKQAIRLYQFRRKNAELSNFYGMAELGLVRNNELTYGEYMLLHDGLAEIGKFSLIKLLDGDWDKLLAFSRLKESGKLTASVIQAREAILATASTNLEVVSGQKKLLRFELEAGSGAESKPTLINMSMLQAAMNEANKELSKPTSQLKPDKGDEEEENIEESSLERFLGLEKFIEEKAINMTDNERQVLTNLLNTQGAKSVTDLTWYELETLMTEIEGMEHKNLLDLMSKHKEQQDNADLVEFYGMDVLGLVSKFKLGKEEYRNLTDIMFSLEVSNVENIKSEDWDEAINSIRSINQPNLTEAMISARIIVEAKQRLSSLQPLLPSFKVGTEAKQDDREQGGKDELGKSSRSTIEIIEGGDDEDDHEAEEFKPMIKKSKSGNVSDKKIKRTNDGIKLSEFLDWCNTMTAQTMDLGKATSIITRLGEVMMNNVPTRDMIKTLKLTPKPPIRPSGTADHVMILVFGSSGEIMPMVKLANMLQQSGMYRVTVVCQRDPAIKLLPECGLSEIGIKVKPLQQLVIEQAEWPDINIGVCASYHCAKEVIAAALTCEDVQHVISNVICYPATQVANHFKATIRFTTPALEMCDEGATFESFTSGKFEVDERFVVRMVNAVAWLAVTGEFISNFTITQLDHRKLPIFGLFPAEWLTLNTAPAKYNIKPLISMEIKEQPETKTKYNEFQLMVLAGSTFGASWKAVMHDLYKDFSDMKILFGVSLMSVESAWTDATGRPIQEKPACWKVTSWVDYSMIEMKVVVTHGGAGLLANLTQRKNKFIIIPMLGDNFANARWLPNLGNAVATDRKKPSILECYKEVMKMKFQKVNYQVMNEGEKLTRVLDWMKDKSQNKVTCKCGRSHMLLSFIGTRGDYNSIVPAAMKLAGDKHVIIMTHYDLMKGIPPGWLQLPLASNSTECAKLAVESLENMKKNIVGPLNHYRNMAGESWDNLARLYIDIDLVLTSFFTPLSYVIGTKLKCEVILIDAIPNKPFFKNGKEIFTGLPVSLTTRGDAIRHAAMELVDKALINEQSTTSPSMLIITCNRNLYKNYVRDDGKLKLMNMFVNDQPTSNRKEPLPLTMSKRNLLITFGSIPCADRMREILDWINGAGRPFNVVLSGTGNMAMLANEPNYVREINYPGDMEEFDVVVHHGGVGTTWNCVKAMTKQVIWPIFGDQFIWKEFVIDENIGHSVSSIDELNQLLSDDTLFSSQVKEKVRDNCSKLLQPYQDDTAEILAKLGWEMNLTGKMKWLCDWRCVGECTIKKPGSYTTNAKVVETVYSPQVVENCVRLCLQSVGELEMSQKWVNLTNPSLGELLKALRALEVNYRLFIESRWEATEVFNTQKPIINLNVGKWKDSWHCTLVKVQVRKEAMMQEKRKLNQQELFTKNVSDKLLEKGSAVTDIVQVNKDAINMVIATIMSKTVDLEERSSRKLNPIVQVTVTKVELASKTLVVIGTTKLKDDCVYVTRMSDMGKISMLYATVFSDRTILTILTDEECWRSQLVLIELESANLMHKQSVRASMRETDWFFVNAEAKNQDKSAKRKHYPVLYNQSYYNLVVNCVDNKNHDKFNYVRAIKNAKTYVLPPGVSKTDFEEKFFSSDDLYFDTVFYKLLPTQPSNKMQEVMAKKRMSAGIYKRKFGKYYAKLDDNYGKECQLMGKPVKTTLSFKDLTEDMDAMIKAAVIAKFNVNDETQFEYDPDHREMLLQIQNVITAGVIVAETRAILTAAPLAAYKQVVKGAGLLSRSYAWWSGESQNTTTKDWWALREVKVTKLPAVSAVEALHGHLNKQMDTNAGRPKLTGAGSGSLTQAIENEWISASQMPIDAVSKITSFEAMVFWSDTEQTNWLNQYAPFESSMKSTEWAQRLMTTTKHTLTKYPEYSRPVQTRVAFEEHRSIAGRLFSIKKIRKETPKVEKVMDDIYAAYFHNKAAELVDGYKSQPLYYSSKNSLKWMEQHKMPSKVYDDLRKTLDAGLYIEKLSDINIHLKLESLLKDVNKVIYRWEQQKARIIVWQRYAVAAIFSPIFTEAKKRMHKLFKNNVVYADGKTPEQLSMFLRGTNRKAKYSMSTDLEQQDRQTDDPLIDVEFAIYSDLGVHEDVLSAWRTVHDDWRFKGTFTKGYRRSMRLTGQSTTAIGNAITTLQTHARFVRTNRDKITYFLVLGDDNNIGLLEYVEVKQLQKEIADNFNMIAKSSIGTVGDFCHFLIYKTSDGYWELGPDYIRLKNRYEVTNGVSEVTQENMLMRTMSYAMTVGATPEINDLIEKENLPIKPTMWYNKHAAMEAMEQLYEVDKMVVIDHYIDLIKMMTERKIYEQQLTVMSSKPRKY